MPASSTASAYTSQYGSLAPTTPSRTGWDSLPRSAALPSAEEQADIASVAAVATASRAGVRADIVLLRCAATARVGGSPPRAVDGNETVATGRRRWHCPGCPGRGRSWPRTVDPGQHRPACLRTDACGAEPGWWSGRTPGTAGP